MKPGRELDALIAERVMGIDVGDIYYDATMQETMPKVPHYSTDIAAAWEVVEKLGEDHGFHITTRGRSAELSLCKWPGPDSGHYVVGDTLSHAICLAALKAVGT